MNSNINIKSCFIVLTFVSLVLLITCQEGLHEQRDFQNYQNMDRDQRNDHHMNERNYYKTHAGENQEDPDIIRRKLAMEEMGAGNKNSRQYGEGYHNMENDAHQRGRGRGHPGIGGHPGMAEEDLGFSGEHPAMIGGGRQSGGRHMGGGQHVQGHQNQVYNNNNNNQSGGVFGSWMYSSFYEILMFVFLGGFVFNCIFGKTHNDKYATAWYNANKQYFEERYDQLGVSKEQETDNIAQFNTPMIKETPYVYKYYAAGYRNIKWLLTILEFRKRQDAVSLLTSFMFDSRDRIVFEAAITPVEDIPWIFCVCKKRDSKNLKKSYPDIDFFTKQYEPSIMNERLVLLSENNELFIDLFLNKIEEHIDIIYYTDQQTFCKDTTGYERRLLEITHFVNVFCDTLAQIKYNQKYKPEFEKNRVQYERSKLQEDIRKEIEVKEKEEFIEQWKMKNKMKGKKPTKKVKNEKEKK